MLRLCLPFVFSLLLQAKRVVVNTDTDFDLDDAFEKTGVGTAGTISVSFNSTSAHVNDVGIIVWHMADGRPTFTNKGFLTSRAPQSWRVGQILGKSDKFVWPINPESVDRGVGFYFDHGVSDLLFGDISIADNSFRPEFDEVVYAAAAEYTPQEVLRRILREEERESQLHLGVWVKDGYFIDESAGRTIQYKPVAKLKTGSWDEQTTQTHSRHEWPSTTVTRPAIMDVDELFARVPQVPDFLRTVQEVEFDARYAPYHGGRKRRRQYRSSRYRGKIEHTIPLFAGRRRSAASSGRRRSSSWLEIARSRRDKQNETNQERQQNEAAKAQLRDSSVNVEVRWLMPVVEKFRCVAIPAHYAHTSGKALYFAMGWDTESIAGMSQQSQDLDIDLAMVPLNVRKEALIDKVVFFGNNGVKGPKTPALTCGQPGSFAMESTIDDRSGDGPGDDEIVRVDLECLGRYHSDVHAVAVLASIYSPAQTSWRHVDSAYLRVVAGGRLLSHQGNFFVRDADGVKSFVRVSGNDMKGEEAFSEKGLVVGLLFRDGAGWTWGTTMTGVPGRHARESLPHIEALARSLAYPANSAWRETDEHHAWDEEMHFGPKEILREESTIESFRAGSLPCMQWRSDYVITRLGNIDDEGLQRISKDEKFDPSVRTVARAALNKPEARRSIEQVSQGADTMSRERSISRRKEIGRNIANRDPRPPTKQESDAEMNSLDDLFVH